MRIHSCSKSALILAALALSLAARPAAPKLDCGRVLMVADGLTAACEIREFTLDAPVSLLVANPASGSVSLYTSDAPQMVVRARILTAAGSESLAQSVGSQVQVNLSAGEVRVSGPSINFNQSWRADLEIYVPASTALQLTTVNGGISVQGVTGSIAVSTVNGAISIAGAAGNVTASDINGSITVSAAAPWNGQTIAAKTVNGNVDIAVPPDCSAHVEMSTVHGNLSTTFPGVNWTVAGRQGNVSFDLGAGGPLLSATTVNGSVAVGPAD